MYLTSMIQLGCDSLLSKYCVCLSYGHFVFCLSTFFQVHLIFFISSYYQGCDSLLCSLHVSGAAEGRGASPQLRVSVLRPSPQHHQPDAGQPHVHPAGQGDDEDGQAGAVGRRPPVQTRPGASPRLAIAIEKKMLSHFFSNNLTLPQTVCFT